MIKVSIIIAVYNGEKYLEKCLKSVVSQTLREIEIICIDNNSSDGTMEILQKFQKKDKRIVIFTKNKNTGYGSSVNLGIKMAKGKYVGFVDSDDYISSEMYRSLYRIAEENKVEIVKCNYFRFTKNKKSKQNLFLRDELNKIIYPSKSQHVLTINSCIWSAIYRKDFLIKNKIDCIEKQNHSYEDTSFSFKAFSSANKIFLIDKAFYYYRIDNESSLTRNKNYMTSIIDEYEEIKKYLQKTGKVDCFSASFTRAKFYGCKWNIERLKLFDSISFAKLAKLTFTQDKKCNLLTMSAMDNYCRNDLLFLINHPFWYTVKTKLKIYIKNI